jgi:hypothetical protein
MLPGMEVASGFTIRLVEARGLHDTQNPYAEVCFGTGVKRTRVHTGGGRIARWNDKFKFEAPSDTIRDGELRVVLGDDNSRIGREVRHDFVRNQQSVYICEQ